jgi:hypothetical protein
MSRPQDAINRLQEIALAIPGIKEAPQEPPESINQFPFSLAYLRSGEATFVHVGWRQYKWLIHLELHFTRQVLPLDIRAAMPYADLLIAALEDDQKLNGTVAEIMQPIVVTFGYLAYGNVDNAHLGFRFEIRVKQDIHS